jgi:hypothetical protein
MNLNTTNILALVCARPTKLLLRRRRRRRKSCMMFFALL